MDAAALRDRIKATLDPNANNRKQAELELRHVRIAWSGPLFAWLQCD